MKELKFTPIYHGMTRGELETEICNAKAREYIDDCAERTPWITIDWTSEANIWYGIASALLFLLATAII